MHVCACVYMCACTCVCICVCVCGYLCVNTPQPNHDRILSQMAVPSDRTEMGGGETKKIQKIQLF